MLRELLGAVWRVLFYFLRFAVCRDVLRWPSCSLLIVYFVPLRGPLRVPLRAQALRKGTWSPEQKQASLGAHGEGTEPGVALADVEAFLKRLFHRCCLKKIDCIYIMSQFQFYMN